MAVRVAIAGAGIGQLHLQAYQELPDKFEVVCICDRNADRAQALAARAPADSARTATDLDEVLAADDIDLIDICLPPHLHADAAVAALQAGKHAICEKPLALSLTDADRMDAAQRESPGTLFPVLQYRFGPSMHQLRAVLDAGIAGAPLVGASLVHWDRGADYYEPQWRGTWRGEGGGAILGHAIHAHDLLCCAFGPVSEVQAELATMANPIEVDDCASIIFRMASGAMATSSVTLGGAGNMSLLRLCYENLTVESDTVAFNPATAPWRFTPRRDLDQQRLDQALAGARDGLDGYAGLFDEIARAIDGQPNEAVTFADARASLELVAAIYAAARSGTKVSLPLDESIQTWMP